jgi:polysaccharide deacetylase family protein (PEP-CTERM system associated)
MKPVLNALTVDVEDWVQSTYDRDAQVGPRVVTNTLRLLDLLDCFGVRATFFVQGMVAQLFPELVREIDRRGHEVGSHGYAHEPILRQSPRQFEEDALRARELIGEITGKAPSGYRAPDFSIMPSTLWALDCLHRLGFTYDSSIFPIRHRRYGIASWPAGPHLVRLGDGGAIAEFPISVLQLGQTRLPFLGGGYTRLLPVAAQLWGIRRLNRSGLPAMLYIHPYELNPKEMDELPISRHSPLRFQQNWGRRSFERKLRTLLATFPFAPAGTILQALGLVE